MPWFAEVPPSHTYFNLITMTVLCAAVFSFLYNPYAIVRSTDCDGISFDFSTSLEEQSLDYALTPRQELVHSRLHELYKQDPEHKVLRMVRTLDDKLSRRRRLAAGEGEGPPHGRRLDDDTLVLALVYNKGVDFDNLDCEDDDDCVEWDDSDTWEAFDDVFQAAGDDDNFEEAAELWVDIVGVFETGAAAFMVALGASVFMVCFSGNLKIYLQLTAVGAMGVCCVLYFSAIGALDDNAFLSEDEMESFTNLYNCDDGPEVFYGGGIGSVITASVVFLLAVGLFLGSLGCLCYAACSFCCGDTHSRSNAGS